MLRPTPAIIALISFALLAPLQSPAEEISNSDVDSLFNELFGDESNSTVDNTKSGSKRSRKRGKKNTSSDTAVSTDVESTASPESSYGSSVESSTSAEPESSVIAEPSSEPAPSTSPTPDPPSWDTILEPVQVIPEEAALPEEDASSYEEPLPDEDDNEDLETAEEDIPAENSEPEIIPEEMSAGVTDTTDTSVSTDVVPEATADKQEEPLTANPADIYGKDSEEAEAYVETQRENSLFGSDEAEADEDEFKAGSKYYNVKYDYAVQVLFAEPISGDTYMEVNYTTHFEVEMVIAERRVRSKTEVQFSADVTGSLARTEIFDCPLDVVMEKTTVDVMTKVNKTESSPDQAGESQLAMQIKFKKKPNEIWSVKCEGMGGALLTRGEKEEYNFQAQDNILPPLAGIQVEFSPQTTTTIDLVTEAFLIDDQDTHDLITISGSGSIIIEPIEAPSESDSDVTIIEEDENNKSGRKSKRSSKNKTKTVAEDPIIEELTSEEEASENTSTE